MDLENLTDQEMVDIVNALVNTMEQDNLRFYVALESAYQLRDELMDVVEIEE